MKKYIIIVLSLSVVLLVGIAVSLFFRTEFLCASLQARIQNLDEQVKLIAWADKHIFSRTYDSKEAPFGGMGPHGFQIAIPANLDWPIDGSDPRSRDIKILGVDRKEFDAIIILDNPRVGIVVTRHPGVVVKHSLGGPALDSLTEITPRLSIYCRR